MKDNERWSAEDGWHCQQIISKLCFLLDHSGLADIDAMFVHEPVVELFGKVLTGIDSIRALFAERTAGKVIRHVLSPAVFTPVGAGAKEAWASSYVAVYRADMSDEPGPRPLDGPVNIVEYQDLFQRQDDGWRIARREISMIFLKQ